jgi:hypothetical protein
MLDRTVYGVGEGDSPPIRLEIPKFRSHKR